MAIRDHKARVRPSVPADGTLTGPPDALPPARVAWFKAPSRSTRSDIALAVLTLTRLRHDSERWRKTQMRGYRSRSLARPLSEAECTRLDAAVQCLLQYARLLGHAPPVSPPTGL